MPSTPNSPGLLEFDRLYAGDCLELFPRVASASIDLVFADPPFNIGYDYDIYDDRREADTYLGWTKSWGREVVRALKPDGTFWLAIGDEYAAELKILFHRELGLSLRSWVIWYYTFGVHCTRKFSRSHAHLFYFVKDPKRFTFNDQSIRVPSARQLVYFDTRANPEGRLPDDTWILRPQDVPDGFAPESDTWYLPRVCGTFNTSSTPQCSIFSSGKDLTHQPGGVALCDSVVPWSGRRDLLDGRGQGHSHRLEDLATRALTHLQHHNVASSAVART